METKQRLRDTLFNFSVPYSMTFSRLHGDTFGSWLDVSTRRAIVEDANNYFTDRWHHYAVWLVLVVVGRYADADKMSTLHGDLGKKEMYLEGRTMSSISDLSYPLLRHKVDVLISWVNGYDKLSIRVEHPDSLWPCIQSVINKTIDLPGTIRTDDLFTSDFLQDLDDDLLLEPGWESNSPTGKPTYTLDVSSVTCI